MTDFFSTYDTEITFIVCAMLGGVMHYLKKFLKGETTAKIHEWYGKENLAATVYTITVFFFAIIGAIAADVVNSQTSFWAAMYSGFVTGFAIDAGFNGDARQMNRDLMDTKNNLNEFLNDKPGQKSYQPRYQSDCAISDDSGFIEGGPSEVVPVRNPARIKFRPKTN